MYLEGSWEENQNPRLYLMVRSHPMRCDAIFGGGAITCKVNAAMQTDANSLRRREWRGWRKCCGVIEAIEGGRENRSSYIFSTRASNLRDAISR